MRRCFEVGMQRNGFTEIDHLFKVESQSIQKSVKTVAKTQEPQIMEKPRRSIRREEKPDKADTTLALQEAPKDTEKLRRISRRSEQNSKTVVETPKMLLPDKVDKTLALQETPKDSTETKKLRRSRRKSEQNSKTVETPKKLLPSECPICSAVPKYYSEDYNIITCRQCSRIIKQIYQSKRVAFCTEQKKCKISPDNRKQCLYCFMKRTFKIGIKMDGFDR